MALFLQAVRLAKLRTASLYFRVLNPIGSFSKIDRDWHELDIMAHDTSAERSRHMRIVPPRDHNNTWTCAHLVAPRRTDEDRTRADPLTRLERLECKVAARNHTIKLRFGLSIADTLRLDHELAHERYRPRYTPQVKECCPSQRKIRAALILLVWRDPGITQPNPRRWLHPNT